MDCEKIITLSERFLKEEGQEIVEAYIATGKLRSAQICLLGALDRELQTGNLTTEDLAKAYADIGLDPGEIADIRNHL